MMEKLNTSMINIVVYLVHNSLRQALLYLTNKSSTKCGNWYDGKAYDQHCDKNNAIRQQIASGKHFSISLTIASLNLEIGIYDGKA